MPRHRGQQGRRCIGRLAIGPNFGIALLLFGLCSFLHPSRGYAAPSCEGQYRFCFRNELSLSQLQKRNPSLWSDIQRKKTLVAKTEPNAQRAQVAADALVGVKNELGAIADRTPALKTVIDALLKDLDATIDWYRLAGVNAVPGDKTPVALERWKIEPGSTDPGGAPEQWLKSVGCWAIEASNACAGNYSAAIELGGQILVVLGVIDEFNSPQRAKNLTALQDRLARWDAYLYGTQFQYVWELMFNRWLDNKFREVPRDDFGNDIGLREPPYNRAVALHPDIGLQLIRGQPKGDRIAPAVTFQWLGYLQWRYKETRVDGLKGISLVSTIADHRGAPAVGTGLMFHWNDYSFAFTSHGGNLAFTFNLKLGDRMSTVNDEWAKEIKKAQDSAAKP